MQRVIPHQRGGDSVPKEAEDGVMWSQAKGGPEASEALRATEQILPRAFGGGATLMTP